MTTPALRPRGRAPTPISSGATAPAPALTTAQAVGIAAELGALMAVCVAVGLFVGQWIDARVGTPLAFTLLGVLVGLTIAATSTVRQYRVALRRRAEELASEPIREDDSRANGSRDGAPTGVGPVPTVWR